MIHDLSSLFFQHLRQAEEEAAKCYEPVIGVVTDNKDPDKLLRVKVKFPALTAAETTSWVPIVSLGAGNQRGWFFLPEVNDEVLVMFEHGDFDHPLVIGALWNGKDKAPETNPGGNPIRVLVSRTGSRIEFDDDKNTITIEDGGGKGSVQFKSDDNKLVLTASQGDVVLSSSTGELKVVAQGGIEMEASLNFDVRGQQNVNIGSGGGTTIKGGAMVALFGAKTDINLPGAADAAAASTSPAALPDPAGK